MAGQCYGADPLCRVLPGPFHTLTLDTMYYGVLCLRCARRSGCRPSTWCLEGETLRNVSCLGSWVAACRPLRIRGSEHAFKHLFARGWGRFVPLHQKIGHQLVHFGKTQDCATSQTHVTGLRPSKTHQPWYNTSDGSSGSLGPGGFPRVSRATPFGVGS